MKKSKKGIEISHWKVGDSDVFAAADPGWTDEELALTPGSDESLDAEHTISALKHEHKHKRIIQEEGE
jgi:hypothetical protein